MKLTTSILYFAIFLSTNLVLPTLALDPAIETKIDELVAGSFMPSHNIPGLGLSILKLNGDTVEFMVRGYGFSNLENQQAATTSTLFAIGSISKSFVGVLIAKVLSEKFPELGESALDTPIRKLIPAANYMLIDRFRSESVTFRDLMAHRLCTLPEMLGLTTAPFKDKQEFIYRQRYAPEYCSFRSSFMYNNGAIGDASELIALVAGETIENLLSQLFLELGMTETTFIQDSVDYETKVNMSTPYYRNGTTFMKYNTELLKRVCYAVAAGGVLSTPNDMLKYLSFHLTKGKVGDRQVVPEEAMLWLRQRANLYPVIQWKDPENSVAAGDIGYGLGFYIGTYDGYERIGHGGYIAPYFSFFSFYPALGVGIFTSASGPGILNPVTSMQLLHAEIVDILRGKAGAQAQPEIPFKKLDVYKEKLALERAPNASKLSAENITGLYGNGHSGEFTVSASSSNDDDLYIQYGRWGTGFLRLVSNSIYRIEWDSDLVQDDFTNGESDAMIDFGEADKAIVIFDGLGIEFIKDQTLDKLPVQPWLPDSCGAAESFQECSSRA